MYIYTKILLLVWTTSLYTSSWQFIYYSVSEVMTPLFGVTSSNVELRN